jgi:hypothetical protein
MFLSATIYLHLLTGFNVITRELRSGKCLSDILYGSGLLNLNLNLKIDIPANGEQRQTLPEYT